ncbi:NADP-dependent malic enzyme [Reichenbachiella agarivorans]|uniref:NADP-dependent malic enzyme n=1 Tax=Reichenbachiella agarivorans TaxID=2979464 RepID=A0ABY6CRW3_9BACT|nr:NADP-dependent malic enzyme [Reichenbachiella agarivorans]UXP33261.1 NADP-dependent malic enzyme [Reichenbachiella agarivorans]
MSIIRKKDALDFHEKPTPGKIEVRPTKTLSTQHDLALAYSPGVAVPCLEIAANKEDVYRYTSKGNLVGVITNGTAVLGLGNIGPEASKPVMEGKGVLFKKFAGIDVFDIEIDETDPDEFIKIVKSLEPTFGGINLEDIKAPESFKIETELREKMNIPVMHDDQHGTAIISSAALLNALIVVGKKIEEVKIVVNGAGGAAIACTDLYVKMGAKKENIMMLDSKGVISKKRENLDPMKAKYAVETDLVTLSDAVKGADVFLGLSMGDVMTAEDLLSMADDPIVFALANPDPEIPYDLAMKTRKDVLMATGRSDHPNQVNNVLGFPYIFRGALDVRATTINEEMKLAAVYALAELTKLPVPDAVSKAYGSEVIKFGKEYLIPKPLDPRLIASISSAVAKAAIDSGVARTTITDWDEYKLKLEERLGMGQRIISRLASRAKKSPQRLVFTEGDRLSILKAAQLVIDEGVAIPILLGNKEKIKELIAENELELDCEIIDPYHQRDTRLVYAETLFQKRARKGMTVREAQHLMMDRNYYGAMMVEKGDADAMISGLSNDYPNTIRPALQIIGMEPGLKRVAGMYIIRNQKGTYFLADTTVNVNPDAEALLNIIELTNRAVKFFDFEPRMAMLSYSNFGSAKGEIPSKTADVVKLAKQKWPEIIIDGEMQANVALNPELMEKDYPFSELNGKSVNTLIFPNLASGNIAYKLLMEIGSSEAIGPVLMGMNKPVHVLQRGSSVREIFNMATIAAVDAIQSKSRSKE